MRIKRYFGKTIKQAIRRVREEQGPDTVILSNRKVQGGFEIIAAIDFDEVVLSAESAPPQGYVSVRPPTTASPTSTHRRSTKKSAHRLSTTTSGTKPIWPLTQRVVTPVQNSDLSQMQDELKNVRRLLERQSAAPVKQSHAPAATPAVKPAPNPAQNRALIEMRGELKNLRRLLERQSAATAKQAHAARLAQEAEKRARARAAKPATDRSLSQMRSELKNLRHLVQQQISGLVWGDVARRSPLRGNVLQRLSQMELSPGLCRQIVSELTQASDPERAWRNALGVLAHKLPVTDDDILTQGGMVALVGPTGVGKTTTIAKLAARFVVHHGARYAALVTTDNYRIGAHEQLRAYAKLLDIPFYIAADGKELRAVLSSLVEKKLVLIDTSGLSPNDPRLPEQLAMLKSAIPGIKHYLTLSASARLSALEDVVRAYGSQKLSGCILTKADEVASLGSALSVVATHRLPVAYVSDGQRVPEDLYTARAHSLVSRSVSNMQRNRAARAKNPFAVSQPEEFAHAC